MPFFRVASFLQRVLLADALISGATGLVLLLGASFLAGLLELPEALLRSAGLLLRVGDDPAGTGSHPCRTDACPA